jgi:germination protein M
LPFVARPAHPGAMTWRRAVVVCGVLVFGVGACGGDDGAAPTATTTIVDAAPTSVPGSSTSTVATPTTAASTSSTTAVATRPVAVYLVRDDKIVAVHREVAGRDDPASALAELLAGPSSAEAKRGFGTAIPTGTSLNVVTTVGRNAIVDLSSGYAGGGGSLSMMLRVAQVTYTITQFPGIDSVSYRIDGRPVVALGGEGLMLDTPQNRQSLEDAQPRILVEYPADGEVVPRRFVARGTSNTFEATHQLQVVDPKGAIVFAATVTATSGTGTRGTWETQVDLPSGTTGALTLRVFEASAKDGTPVGVADTSLTVG